jgi:hypothetical protein
MGRRIAVVLSVLLLAWALTGCGRVGATPPADFPYLPLWPFAAPEEADRWLRVDAPGGHSPWHADAEATALFFTQNYLGLDEIDRAIASTEQAGEAWVDVGYALPDGKPTTAATIHLARFGTDPGAPWEVVGTRDEALTLDTPPYGSAVGPVIGAGGKITGVDESLHLQVRQIGREGVLGELCCVAAGGAERPWSAQVNVTGAAPGVLTLVVWTGGHVADVERFAINGLRAT